MRETTDAVTGPSVRGKSGHGQNSAPEHRGARRLISPFRCRVWALHSRPEERLTEEECKSLRESIATNGQHQPALGRPVSDDPDFDVEIICGARRHAVARSLGRDLLVEVRDLTDAEAFVAMYEENLLREGDSPYIRGQILLRALRTGTYTSQEHLGRAFNLSHSSASRLLTLAQLPSVIVAAFSSPNDIKEGWGVELHRLWSEISTKQALAARARSLIHKSPKPPAREVYETLISPPALLGKNRRYYRNVPIRGSSGAVLFYEQDQLTKFIYAIPKACLSPHQRELLRRSIVRVLEKGSNESRTPDTPSGET